ncbi:hypothetical protein [Paenibacillus sp. R14(2021)]|uniref:hypothetical protein n=1 Tax=Paenibacillus sp. R14(2021) TaxID=2859228 RepID=UPI00215850C9|nr:hypothetical protein [Paenibacillus sp. R14(2021)]
MNNATKYIGMDVSKETIAVAIAESGREEPRFWGIIPHKPEAVRKWWHRRSYLNGQETV